MKLSVPVIVVLVLLVFFLFIVGSLTMQAAVHRDYDSSYMSPPYYSGYRGSGPEWDKLAEAERKGISGYVEVQALMASSDTLVAEQACMYLVRKHTDETFALFFEKLPSVDQTVKDSLRSASYRYEVVVAAAEAVKARDEKTKEGAITFLNLCYSRDIGGSSVRDEAFKTVVSAIPDYTGADADKLAYTVGLFRPSDTQPLVALLGHSEARVRKTAVTALGKMEATEALASVQKLKSDPAASVRTAAATAESSLNAAAISAASYSAPRPPDARDYAMENARTNARKRLGMP